MCFKAKYLQWKAVQKFVFRCIFIISAIKKLKGKRRRCGKRAKCEAYLAYAIEIKK